MKVIDLSVEIENSSSEPMRLKHSRKNHADGAKEISERAGISLDSFPEHEFLTLDTFKLATHMGTHIDSPYHFGSHFLGEKARTIDQLPLNWFFGKAIKLDFSTFSRKKNISKKDIIDCLTRKVINIHPGDIVLIQTGMDKLFGQKEYFTDGPGMSREATEYLINCGVKVMGIDAYGFDRSFPVMLNEYKRTGDKRVLWPSHFLGRKKEYVHIERLTNLDLLPSQGFYVCAMPLKLKDGDASWTRAIAMLGDEFN